MDEAATAALESLTAQMFAEPIATGEIIVTDPEPSPVPVAPEPPAAPVTAAEAPPVAETPPAPETPSAVPTFKPKIDDDLRALLDEPDFEAEATAEVQAELAAEDGEYEYSDPEATAKQRAAEKRIAFLEGQLVAKSKKGWIEEAKRVYPDLARLIPGEIEGITATSRKSFLRAADAANTKYSTALGPTLAKLEAERAAIASGAVEVAREEVANAWGRPGADTLPPLKAAQKDALDKARAKGDLEGSIKILMEDTPVL